VWVDSIPDGKGWTVLWSGRVLCICGGIRLIDVPCPACEAPPYDCSPQTVTFEDGSTVTVPPAFAGAEGRYEDYLYLEMMEREWTRTEPPEFQLLGSTSAKASVVLLFWTYFETRIERLLRVGFNGVPTALVEDTLDRYSSIGARLDRLYKVLFGTTYEKDLKEIGCSELWAHLREVQKRRNDFMHGNPQAFDDPFVERVVNHLQDEHEAWIAVFNRRVRAQRVAH
jgi:hypothetical protein